MTRAKDKVPFNYVLEIREVHIHSTSCDIASSILKMVHVDK
jgi:hypothetical protein